MRKVFVRKLIEFASSDSSIMLLTGDLGFSVFDEYKKLFPKQFLNVGLSEQSMIGMASGMALEGKKVFVYSIIPFLIYRALEQIRNDLCYQKLPVKLIGVGSGLVYGGQGGTHHAIEDLGIMTSLPDIMVFAPGDPLEVEKIIEHSLNFELPCYIRLNKAGDTLVNTTETIKHFELGKPLRVKGSGTEKVAILAAGNILPLTIEIFEDLSRKGLNTAVYSVHTLKPIAGEALNNILMTADIIVIIEEHIQRNGLYTLVSSFMQLNNLYNKNILCFSLDDCFVHKVGKQDFLREATRLNKSGIIDAIVKRCALPPV